MRSAIPHSSVRTSTTAIGLALCAVVFGGSCVITEGHKGADEVPVIRSTQPERMWEVLAEGSVIGSVVLFESESDSFFSVRNEWQQDVGMIDSMGRAWAFQPHNEEAEWVGSGGIATGAGQILGATGEVEIREVELAKR